MEWLISFLFVYFSFFLHFLQHGYYLTSMCLFAVLGTSYGIDPFLKTKRWRVVALILIIMVPIVMVGRVGHRWISAKQVPIELLERPQDFQNLLPVDEQVLIIEIAQRWCIYIIFIEKEWSFLQTFLAKQWQDIKAIDFGMSSASSHFHKYRLCSRKGFLR